jgi:hypothetical protein
VRSKQAAPRWWRRYRRIPADCPVELRGIFPLRRSSLRPGVTPLMVGKCAWWGASNGGKSRRWWDPLARSRFSAPTKISRDWAPLTRLLRRLFIQIVTARMAFTTGSTRPIRCARTSSPSGIGVRSTPWGARACRRVRRRNTRSPDTRGVLRASVRRKTTSMPTSSSTASSPTGARDSLRPRRNLSLRHRLRPPHDRAESGFGRYRDVPLGRDAHGVGYCAGGSITLHVGDQSVSAATSDGEPLTTIAAALRDLVNSSAGLASEGVTANEQRQCGLSSQHDRARVSADIDDPGLYQPRHRWA